MRIFFISYCGASCILIYLRLFYLYTDKMKTYDIYFTDGRSTDNKGFSIKTEEKAIHMAEDMLEKGNSYIREYAGGTIMVVDSEGKMVWSKPIPD